MPIHIKPACKAPSHLSFLGRSHLLNAAHLPSPAAKALECECLPKSVQGSALLTQSPMAQQRLRPIMQAVLLTPQSLLSDLP